MFETLVVCVLEKEVLSSQISHPWALVRGFDVAIADDRIPLEFGVAYSRMSTPLLFWEGVCGSLAPQSRVLSRWFWLWEGCAKFSEISCLGVCSTE